MKRSFLTALLPSAVVASLVGGCGGEANGPSDAPGASEGVDTTDGADGGSLEPVEFPPPFGSTVDTVFDLVEATDESVFACLEPLGRGERQAWDKRVDGEPVIDAWLFRARFRDGLDVEMIVNPEFGSIETARAEAERHAEALGRLPSTLRRGVGRFVVHAGAEGPHAGPGGGDMPGGITMYADTTDRRIADDHLEETLFHESVHASWERFRLAPDWIAAQGADPTFLTDYARRFPEQEDLPESALFAYAVLHHPERLPPVDRADTERAIPNRIAFVATLLPPDRPIFDVPVDGADDTLDCRD